MIANVDTFIQCLSLLVALFLQRNIEPQYSIAKEIFYITVVWSFFSWVSIGVNIYGINPFKFDKWGTEEG
jgi:hypothetical protein